MRVEPLELSIVLGLLHHGIDGTDYLGRIAVGVVAGQFVATQSVHHKAQCRLEYLRLGPAEPVDALLGVTHDKHFGCGHAPPRTGIARQPVVKRLPL